MKLFYLNKNIFFFFLFFLIIENAQAQVSFNVPTSANAFTTIAGGNRRMKSADFNKDGIQDVVACTTVPFGTPLANLAVVLGSYTGVMNTTPTLSYAVPTLPVALGGLTTADFDGDGDIDIATIGVDKNLYTLKNNFPVAGFSGATSFPTPSPTSYSASTGFTELEAVDYDQDGDIDLLTVAQNLSVNTVFIYIEITG